jgi:hypothetical protein
MAKKVGDGVSRRAFLHTAGAGAGAAVVAGIPALESTAKAHGAQSAKPVESVQNAPSGLHEGYRSVDEVWGQNYATRPLAANLSAKPSGLAGIYRWNQIAIDASGLDHTPPAPGENRVWGSQLGPCRAARAIAIVQVAVFEAMNAIEGKYESYLNLFPASKKVHKIAAVAQAAHDSLVALFPGQKAQLDAFLAEDLDPIPNKKAKTLGISLGRTAALAALGIRTNDHSEKAEPKINVDFMPSNQPGKWRQDPVSLHPLAVGAYWGEVTPFVLESADQFRVPPPPAMESAEYTTAFNEAKQYGGDGVNTETIRTEDQTHIGIFWAYDGTPSLCAPPRLYNQILQLITKQMGENDIDTARIFALANVAMADAGIASWESKFFYQFWRPVGGVREADEGFGPSGLGDGNPDTICDPGFMPLGAPASNLTGPNFTPPFPTYPSGHATFGGALFQTLRNIYGTDNVSFTFVSDEFNGETVGNDGQTRPYLPRDFTSFSQAEEENGQSRIYLGIHWSFDKTSGINQGRSVADYAFARAFRPVQR